MKITKEMRIGFVAIVALGMLIWGINFLKGRNLFSDVKTYYAIYPEITGVSESTPVIINGYKIGQVKTSRLLQEQNNHILVSFDVQKDYFLPVNTVAEITGTDLLGGKALNLIFPESYNRYHQPGDTLQAVFDPGLSALTENLQDNVNDIISTTDSVLLSISETLDEKTRQHIKNTLANIDQTTHQLKYELGPQGNIYKILADVKNFTASLDDNKPAIDSTLNNIAQLSGAIQPEQVDSIANSIESLLHHTKELMTEINRGEGTLGQVMKNDTLYQYLSSSIAHLDSLLIDLKENPKRYVHFSVFGKKDKN
ncbi:MAG: MlaD family protein [Bacteroidota bacterium]